MQNHFLKLYRVFPPILRVDISAKLDQSLTNVDPTMESRDVERSPVIVILSVHQTPIFLQKLPDCGGVVLVGVPQYHRRPAHSRLLLLLLTRTWHCQRRSVPGSGGVVGAALTRAHFRSDLNSASWITSGSSTTALNLCV